MALPCLWSFVQLHWVAGRSSCSLRSRRALHIASFKGLYWQLKSQCPFQPRAKLTGSDLNVPFLGVHFTPSADAQPLVTIGPTATPAWGRENYRGLDAVEP